MVARGGSIKLSDADALAMVMEMMAIPGRPGEEAAIMDFIRQKLIAAGAPANAITMDNAHKRTPLGGQVGNMILKLPGTMRGPRRMLSAHVDTVPICVGSRPVRKGKVVVSADKKTGLGADDRAGAAVVLLAALAVLKVAAPHPPLTFLWTIEEEVGLFGARFVRLAKLGNPKLAFNFDGGSPAALKVGATGGYRMTIEIEGLASHAGNRPEEGVSAIAIASLAIADLVNNGWHGLVEKEGKTGTSNVGVIKGGDATNVVTDHVFIRAEARSHEAKFRGRIVKEIEGAFKRAALAVQNTAGQNGKVTIEGDLDYESFRLSRDEPCVTVAAAAIAAEGIEPELAVTNGGLDANWLTAHGIPTVTLGCGQRNIHTVSEQLDIAEFQQARRIALRLATGADSK
ncbi:MAG TPA: M20/M25/M40 family metallo-hydrolase [Lacipirellulaceae bacterium]|jgi:tripeptide aminopeptidase|nr:M20/M25/M40 family metallo-hydrolase [Lacipirellulaceae bacterium]